MTNAEIEEILAHIDQQLLDFARNPVRLLPPPRYMISAIILGAAVFLAGMAFGFFVFR